MRYCDDTAFQVFYFSSQFETKDHVIALQYKLYDLTVLTLVYLPVCLDFGHLFG